jgi:hypothetical protein
VTSDGELKRAAAGGRGAPETTPPNSAPHVVIQADRRARDPISIGAPKTAWQMFGWLGVLLVVLGGSDVLSQWFATAFQSREWAFGTAAATISSLPLLTIGLVVLLGSFLARGKREAVTVMGVLFLLLFMAVAAILALFALDVPLALHAPDGASVAAARRAIVRTAVMGGSDEVAYVAAAILAFRYAAGRVKDR